MRRDLGFGPEVVDLFLPQRAPFRMVDRLHDYTPGSALEASKLVATNEPVFAGHFPDFPLWPGVYTLEGLAQATNLLLALDGVVEAVAGGWPDLRRALTAHRARRRMEPTQGPELPAMPDLRQAGGVLASADLKWARPVFAGDVLHYTVTDPRPQLSMVAVRVEAHVGGETVARGELVVAPRPLPGGTEGAR